MPNWQPWLLCRHVPDPRFDQRSRFPCIIFYYKTNHFLVHRGGWVRTKLQIKLWKKIVSLSSFHHDVCVSHDYLEPCSFLPSSLLGMMSWWRTCARTNIVCKGSGRRQGILLSVRESFHRWSNNLEQPSTYQVTSCWHCRQHQSSTLCSVQDSLS